MCALLRGLVTPLSDLSVVETRESSTKFIIWWRRSTWLRWVCVRKPCRFFAWVFQRNLRPFSPPYSEHEKLGNNLYSLDVCNVKTERENSQMFYLFGKNFSPSFAFAPLCPLCVAVRTQNIVNDNTERDCFSRGTAFVGVSEYHYGQWQVEQMPSRESNTVRCEYVISSLFYSLHHIGFHPCLVRLCNWKIFLVSDANSEVKL